jgi:asparagine synthase (glutamine-hydrolysing)
MCGFAGYLDLSAGQSNEELLRQASCMAQTLRHRGPDDAGAWADANSGIAFGFRRLSILDLSPHGHQPMHSKSGRYVIVFNGEIYNFESLRRSLEDHHHLFVGRSDTEVLLAAIDEWGVEDALERFNGMFAFALWDRDLRQLHLARDRLGEKPLYYGWCGSTFVFGSELKALRAYARFSSSVDSESLFDYLRYNCIPAPRSIYKSIFKVPPATLLSLKSRGSTPQTQSMCYWSAKESVLDGIAEPFQGNSEEAVNQLEELLRDSVRLRMSADVPVGAFLSGGIDSSAVVSLMRAENESPIRTFSIGFAEHDYDEAVYAKRVAEHLGTIHNELYVSSTEAIEAILQLPCIYDEPFADSSQIPTFLVSQLARRQVTVALSGDGGDELFGGYNRYTLAPRIWRGVGWLPKGIRKVAAGLLWSLSPQVRDLVFETLLRSVSGAHRPRQLGEKLQKLAEIVAADNPEQMYGILVSECYDPTTVLRSPLTRNFQDDLKRDTDLTDMVARMMYLDTVTYLPDDILVKLDRATMAASLEARVPLLDHRLVEFAWKLPLSLKIRRGQGKWVLRQVLHKYLPSTIIERPKAGFAVPLSDWLRGPLHDWADSLLDERRLRTEGFFNAGLVRQRWHEHMKCKHNWQGHLWGILMFEAWLDSQK